MKRDDIDMQIALADARNFIRLAKENFERGKTDSAYRDLGWAESAILKAFELLHREDEPTNQL